MTTETTDERKNAVILVVDDLSANLRQLCQMLEWSGYRVMPAQDGATALHVAKSAPPDLILLDIRMPGMDGYEVCACFKKESSLKDIPVIFISALGDIEDKVKAFEAGGVDYITKPFQQEEVLARVATHLELRHVRLSLQHSSDILEERVRQRTVALEEAIATLRDSEDKFRSVADFTYDWEYWLGSDGRMIWMSPSCERITEYRVEEFMADPGLLCRIIHPDDTSIFDAHLCNVKAGSIEPCEMDFRIVRRSGQIIWINHFCVAITGTDGVPLGRRASNRDITDRKQAENKLTRELALNKAMSELSGALIAKATTLQDIADITLHYSKRLTASDHGFVSVIDPRTRDLVCYTLTQMMDKECRVGEGQNRIVFPPNPDECYPKLWGHALNTRHPFYTNCPETHPSSGGAPDGHIALRNFLAVPALNGDKLIGLIALANSHNEYTDRDLEAVQHLAGLYAVAIDRQKTVEALWTSEQQIRGLFNATTDSVMLLDDTANILAINEGGAKRRGLSPQDLVGKNLKDVLRPDIAACRQEGMAESARVKHSVDIDEIHGDRWYHVRIFPILDEVGKVAQFATFSRDVTDRIMGEKALRDALTHAEQLAVKAEAANKAKSEFLANMSHEIRTPLNGIMGMMQLLKVTVLSTEQTEYLDIALNAAKGLVEIIDDILDLSRIEHGVFELRQEGFDLRRTLASLVEMFQVEVKSKNLRLNITIDENIEEIIFGDEGRLSQILFNLIGNAIKFTKAGEVSIEVSILKQFERQIHLLFKVSDTGIGIPADKIDIIFDQFTQVDGSYTRKYGGTGLGLCIVKKLIDGMGGHIRVTSELGKGTTVFFDLKFSPYEPLVTNDIELIKSLVTVQTTGIKVLVVEDDAINRLNTMKFLEKFGCRARWVEDGDKVIGALENEDYDLILMDIQMPNMDGVKATRLIRESGKLYAEIPIVALTAHAMQGDRAKYLAAGMNDYISKPVKMKELEELIKRISIKPTG
jgi:PAS domain S-box-containing protein